LQVHRAVAARAAQPLQRPRRGRTVGRAPKHPLMGAQEHVAQRVAAQKALDFTDRYALDRDCHVTCPLPRTYAPRPARAPAAPRDPCPTPRPPPGRSPAGAWHRAGPVMLRSRHDAVKARPGARQGNSVAVTILLRAGPCAAALSVARPVATG